MIETSQYFIFTDTENVVRIEILPENRVLITGSKLLYYDKSQSVPEKRHHLWFTDDTQHTAIQEISRGTNGIRLRRYLPLQSFDSYISPYKLDTIQNAYVKSCDQPGIKETESMTDIETGSESFKIHSKQKTILEGNVNPGFSDEEIGKMPKIERNNNAIRLPKLIFDTDAIQKAHSLSDKQDRQKDSTVDKNIDFNDSLIVQNEITVEETKPNFVQKSDSFSDRSKNPPTAEILPNLHQSEDHNLTDDVIIDVMNENSTNDISMQDNTCNSDSDNELEIQSGTTTVEDRVETTNAQPTVRYD